MSHRKSSRSTHLHSHLPSPSIAGSQVGTYPSFDSSSVLADDRYLMHPDAWNEVRRRGINAWAPFVGLPQNLEGLQPIDLLKANHLEFSIEAELGHLLKQHNFASDVDKIISAFCNGDSIPVIGMPPGPHSGFKEDVFYASFMKGYSFRFYGGGSGASSIGLFFMDIYDIDRKCAVAIPDYFAFFKRERPIDAQTPLDGTGDQPMATIEDLFETRIRQPNGFAPEKFAVAEGDRGYVLDKRQTGWVREFMVPMRAGHADKPTSSPH